VVSSIVSALENIYLKNNKIEHYERITETLLKVADVITDNNDGWDEQDPIMLCFNNGYTVLHQSLINFSANYKCEFPDYELANKVCEHFVKKVQERSDWKIRCAVAFQLRNYRFLLGRDKCDELRLFDAEGGFITAIMTAFFLNPLYTTKLFSDLQHGDLIIQFIENQSVRNYQMGDDLINNAAAYLFLAYLKGDIDFGDDSNAISKLPSVVDGEMFRLCVISATRQLNHIQASEIAVKVDIFLFKLLEHHGCYSTISSSNSDVLFEYIEKSGAPTENVWRVIEIIMSATDYLHNGDVMWEVLNKYIDTDIHHECVVRILETIAESCNYLSKEQYPYYFELLNHPKNSNDETQKIRNILIRRGVIL
jgi:hypothetical protein